MASLASFSSWSCRSRNSPAVTVSAVASSVSWVTDPVSLVTLFMSWVRLLMSLVTVSVSWMTVFLSLADVMKDQVRVYACC